MNVFCHFYQKLFVTLEHIKILYEGRDLHEIVSINFLSIMNSLNFELIFCLNKRLMKVYRFVI